MHFVLHTCVSPPVSETAVISLFLATDVYLTVRSKPEHLQMGAGFMFV
jgi:hypothetical protein